MNQLLSNQCHKLEEELDQKGKIIDLMTNHMYAMQAITHISEFESQEDVKKYFEKIAKEILNK